MIFEQTPLEGAYVLEIEPHADERGFFARTVAIEEFAAQGLNGSFVQQSVSWNPVAGTLRGLHFQIDPYAEEKLVRVTRGAIYDVVVDMRPNSATRGRWCGVELSASNHRQIYVPKGFAHGFQTLLPDTEVLYQMTTPFKAEAARGIRWDDPALAITWPMAVQMIGEKDKTLPAFV